MQRAYLYRSVSATFPSGNEADLAMSDEKVLALYRTQRLVLEGNMRILKDLMRFVAESRVLFKSAVAEGSERRFTDVLATRLIEIVDLVRPRLPPPPSPSSLRATSRPFTSLRTPFLPSVLLSPLSGAACRT